MDSGECLVLGLESIAVAIVGTDRRCGFVFLALARFHLGVGVERGSGLHLVAGFAFAALAGFLILRFTLAFSLALTFFGGFGLGFGFFVFFAFGVVVVRLVGDFIAHAEIAQQFAHHRRERGLIVHAGLRTRQRHASLFGQFRAPHRGHLFRRRRQLAPGQDFAEHELQRIVHGGAGLVGDACIAGPLAALLQDGVEILRDAIHRCRADRLDAGAFGRLEKPAGVFTLRHRLRVLARIMVRHPQGEGIGLTTRTRGGGGRQILRGRCKRDLPVLNAAAIDRELHGKLVLSRDCARGGRQGGLEDIGAIDGFGHGSLPPSFRTRLTRWEGPRSLDSPSITACFRCMSALSGTRQPAVRFRPEAFGGII